MANCLVLGSNGFLGSHLVDKLVSDNHKVRAFDKYFDSTTKFFPSENIEIYSGEFLNETDLNDALNGIDYVFHFISTTTPISSESNPLVEIDTNIRYSVELFQRCVENNVKKVIYASSGGSVYGNVNLESIDETVLVNPISPYAIGKLSVEKFLGYFREKAGLDSVIYRISNPYGTRQSLNAKQGVIPIFLNQVLNDEPITVFGDGSMVRDFIYVSDVANMIAESFAAATSNLYNIGSGQGVSVNELIETIDMITQRNPKIIHVPAPSTFVDKNVLNTSKFSKEFNIGAQVSLVDGIKNTWEHFVQSEKG